MTVHVSVILQVNVTQMPLTPPDVLEFVKSMISTLLDVLHHSMTRFKYPLMIKELPESITLASAFMIPLTFPTSNPTSSNCYSKRSHCVACSKQLSRPRNCTS